MILLMTLGGVKMSKFSRAKKNLILLKIFEIKEYAEKTDNTITIDNVPKWVVKFFRDCGLEDYLTRGIISWDTECDDITILGNHHFAIKNTIVEGTHINFYKIKEEINDYCKGICREEYYTLPKEHRNRFLTPIEMEYLDYRCNGGTDLDWGLAVQTR